MRAVVLVALITLALSASGQSFPAKPISLICPWPPGGTTDTHLRKFAEVAAKYLGQPVVIDNKPGGGGMVGPAQMARLAKPDGYTVAQLPITAFRLPHQRPVDWDALADFTYIIGITGYTFGVVVRADSPYKTLAELLEYARANPGQVSYATPGTGTSPHLLMEEVAMKAGVKMLHVPYKGYAEGAQALLGGHVIAHSDSTGWGRFVDAGQMRLLVTFGEKRTKWNAPTARELGYDVVSYSPYGIVGPKGMDAAVVRKLHDAFKRALDDPEHLKTLASLDQVYWYKSSAEYARWAAETLAAERATIERLGLAGKQN
ncbi:MAG: tripartite tricarboxylate transporter substrate binding protein [Burkholderiales bacterium]